MIQTAAKRLTRYLRDELEVGLRTVVIVQEESHEIYYLRQDLREEYTEATYEQVIETFRLDDSSISPEIDGTPVGDRRAVVHYHENAFVLQFPFSETESVLISITPEAGRSLLQFIEDCRQLVDDGR